MSEDELFRRQGLDQIAHPRSFLDRHPWLPEQPFLLSPSGDALADPRQPPKATDVATRVEPEQRVGFPTIGVLPRDERDLLASDVGLTDSCCARLSGGLTLFHRAFSTS